MELDDVRMFQLGQVFEHLLNLLLLCLEVLPLWELHLIPHHLDAFLRVHRQVRAVNARHISLLHLNKQTDTPVWLTNIPMHYGSTNTAESRCSWTSTFGISTFRNRFRRIAMRPHGWVVGFLHSPVTAQITLSSVTHSAFYRVWLFSCFTQSDTPSSTSRIFTHQNCQSVITIKVMDFTTFQVTLHVYYQHPVILATKYALHTANKFRCSLRVHPNQSRTSNSLLQSYLMLSTFPIFARNSQLVFTSA